MAIRKNLLIVDDSQVARMMIRGYIQDFHPDWQIDEASDAEQALLLLKSNEYHMATIDLNMPGMNGLELCEQIKVKDKNIRLILLTANIQKATQQKAEALQIEFVTKPVTEAKIRAMLAR